MDLRQMRYFVAVADERNVTRAAKVLHMAQPPLSRQIQRLEEELGVTLLLRNSRPLRLTDSGRFFYDQARQILSRVEQIKTATRRVGKSERTVLSVGFVASTLYSGLPTLVRQLRQRRPDVDVQLVEMMSMQQMDALKAGRIDVGFGRVRASDPSLERLVLREERLVVAFPADSAFAAESGAMPLAALEGQRLIVYPKEPRPSFADQVLSLLQDKGIHPGDINEVRELQSALGLVAADDGICVVPASTRFIRSDLRYRMIEDEHATSPIIMSYRINDRSEHIDLMKTLTRVLYAEPSPPEVF
jgi:LysR family transcriptional regulator, benzoate and cis,cis-muconate-responsive activator of ben and cat genes